jgi:hypothetical protein
MPSRLTSRAAAFAGQAGRAALAHAQRATASANGRAVENTSGFARLNSYTSPTIVLTSADLGGGTAKITVASHSRVYPGVGSVAITGADIVGLPNAQDTFVYYDDATLADSTPAFLTTTVFEDAQPAAAAGRHFVGAITTDAAAGGGTTGSGGSRPATWGADIP